MATQACPACGTLHDVGIYVSGKRIRCRSCGIPFTVQRAESLVAARAFRSRHAAKHQPSRPFQPPARSSARQRKTTDTSPSGGSLHVPGYQIKEMLGKGGMGRVYRALQVSLDRWVAIKILNEDLAKHHSFIRRFEKESGALASLNHPNIIAIYDRGCHEGVYYFVMEYVGGPSLRRRMHDGLKVRECVQIMSTLCKAVAHAHRRSVIHRDIKPENVLFTEEGVLKVADFGLANIIAPDGRWELTRTRVSMGTVNYMAPEQRRDAKHVDGRADIYSLGVIFYEILTGEFPVGRFQPPSRLRPGLDPRLDRIVMRMLESQPSRRPQNADLIAATLDSWLQEAGKAEAAQESADRIESAQSTRPRTSGEPRARRHHKKGLGKLLTVTLASRLGRWVSAGIVVAAIAAVAFWFLVRHNLGEKGGDLRLEATGSGQYVIRAETPSRIEKLAPASQSKHDGVISTSFDFMPSSRTPVQVRFVGGSWNRGRGMLVQDTCTSGFTINQTPARALVGSEAIKPEGVSIKATMELSPSEMVDNGKRLTMEQYLEHKLGTKRVLVPGPLEHRAGLAFMDTGGNGIEFLLEPGKRAFLLRRGGGGQSPDRQIELGDGAGSEKGRVAIGLVLEHGRVRAELNGRVVFDELSGLPLDFEGYPAVSCQNMRCAIRRLEVTAPAGK